MIYKEPLSRMQIENASGFLTFREAKRYVVIRKHKRGKDLEFPQK